MLWKIDTSNWLDGKVMFYDLIYIIIKSTRTFEINLKHLCMFPGIIDGLAAN